MNSPMFFSKWLDRLETRYGRYRGIRNLMTIIVAGMAIVYVADMLLAPALGFSLSSFLYFDKAAIFRGEVWRVFTFIFLPPESSMFFILFSLLFYHSLGETLQNDWGTFRFTLYYMCGMLGTVIAGTLTGYATSYYLNMSLFLAVAILYPDRQLNFYGILPIRFKWMALVDVVLMLPTLLYGTWASRIALLVSLLNVLLFFMDRLLHLFRDAKRRYEWRKNWRNGNWR